MKISMESAILGVAFVAIAALASIPARGATLGFTMTPDAQEGGVMWAPTTNSWVSLQVGGGPLATITYHNGIDHVSDGLTHLSWVDGVLCNTHVHFDIGLDMTLNSGGDPRDVITFKGILDPDDPGASIWGMFSWEIENAEYRGPFTGSSGIHRGGFSAFVSEGETATFRIYAASDVVCGDCSPAPVPLPATGWLLAAALIILARRRPA